MNTEVKGCIKEMVRQMVMVLENNILPFWTNRMVDSLHGGYYGRMTGRGIVEPEAVRGAVLNARILWAFSAAYRVLKRPEYLEQATRAKRVLIDTFYDKEYGGVYWSTNYKGVPLDKKKQTYALGFAIYGLSEYVRATSDAEALEYAIRLYNDIESHCFDNERNGYWEALTREWRELGDVRLSDKDLNERKTTNTHLHILEPYTNLYRVWPQAQLGERIRNLASLFEERIWNSQTGHLRLFFSDNWENKSDMVSYGHDIEASWLLHEAALVLGDEDLLTRVEPVVRGLAQAACEGLNQYGGMAYEYHPDIDVLDEECHWWVQAETVVGYLNMYQHWGDEADLRRACRCWEFTKHYLIDFEDGEWWWSVMPPYWHVNMDENKAGFWKCPYHNSRMCLEVVQRFRHLK